MAEVATPLGGLAVHAKIGQEKARRAETQRRPDRQHERKVDAAEEKHGRSERDDQDAEDTERDLFGEMSFDAPAGDREVRSQATWHEPVHAQRG